PWARVHRTTPNPSNAKPVITTHSIDIPSKTAGRTSSVALTIQALAIKPSRPVMKAILAMPV
ncbi:MAG: hypothetical protein MOB07_19865, partial [Acidobacteria bacterium]|nr:hypothetical protein [Acidobacteriota bacterium]